MFSAAALKSIRRLRALLNFVAVFGRIGMLEMELGADILAGYLPTPSSPASGRASASVPPPQERRRGGSTMKRRQALDSSRTSCRAKTAGFASTTYSEPDECSLRLVEQLELRATCQYDYLCVLDPLRARRTAHEIRRLRSENGVQGDTHQ